MSLSISIPDDFAEVLGATAEERDQRAREALALELYREGRISLRRMGELAGVGGDYWAAENFRIWKKAPLNDSIEASRSRSAGRGEVCQRIILRACSALHRRHG